VILDRHTAMVSNYRKELNIMLGNIQAISSAANSAEKQQRAELAAKHLKKKQHHRPNTFDPDNLPNSSEKPNKNNHPKTSEQAFNDAGFTSSPLARVAVNAPFTYANLAGASDPAYLAETTEIKLTPAIQAKATELNHDPVAIFNFVRNNVQWLPTWGAMQTADHTLDSLKGNAMDISSLTIALLRASGVPARYRHGTIDVLADRFMNWAGGFTDITAAADHASSGGIPVASVVRGGKIYKVRMEHVWVEAAIDYYPSRGAINKDADSWIAMDTSFKQYQFAPGMDINAIAPFDAYGFAQQYLQTMQIDGYGAMTQTPAFDAYGQPTTAGQLLLQQAVNDRQAALINHINTNDPYATVQDVIGGAILPQDGWPHLPSALPNATVTQGVSYGALPSSLEYRISFQFNNVDAFGFPSTSGTPLTLPLPELNNQKVTVSFRPATPADEQVLTSLMAGVTDIYSLATSIPAYLIKVIPELKLNGSLVMSGTAVQMGADQLLNYTISHPDGRTRSYTSNFEAGMFHSVGVVGGSIAKSNSTNLQARVSQLQADLYAGIISSFNKESFMGDMFYAGMLGYFSMYSGLSRLKAHVGGVNHLLMPSLGTYGASANVTYLFGFPRSLGVGGIVMDIGNLVSVTSSKDGNNDSRFSFVLQSGVLSSALEHIVPEQMFSTATKKAEAISTVKLLGLAAQQGMPILHITLANSATTISQLKLDPLVISEIQSAVLSGKEVIVHQSNITAYGWSGSGYIIIDPLTGDGAYRISSLVNGGKFAYIYGVQIGYVMALAVISGNPFLIAAAIGNALAMIAGYINLLRMYVVDPASGMEGKADPTKMENCLIGGLAFGVLLGGVSGAALALAFPSSLGATLGYTTTGGMLVAVAGVAAKKGFSRLGAAIVAFVDGAATTYGSTEGLSTASQCNVY